MNDNTRTQNILRKLISFRTVTGNGEEVQKAYQYITSLFFGLPVETKVFQRNGIYSQITFFRGNSWMNPVVLLNAHIDVVPSQNASAFVSRREGTKLYGRGASDMKGPLTAFLLTMEELAALPKPSQAALLITADEEVGGEYGAGYMATAVGIKPKFVINGDGAQRDPSVILTKARGAAWIGLTAKGKSAHGARPWLGENAVDKVIAATEKIKRLIGDIEAGAWKSTANLSWVETPNRTPNMVPDFARAVLDIRFTEELAQNAHELVSRLQLFTPEVSISLLEASNLFVTNIQDNFVQRFQKAVEAITNKKTIFGFDEGSNDGRYFAETGIPVVVTGAGGGNRHGDNEWVDLKNIFLLKEILVRFLQNP